MIPTFIPYEDQDELGSAIIEVREGKAQKNKLFVDIEEIARSFGLTIRYECFAEDDPNKDGFLANGKDKLKIWRKGVRTEETFPMGTIVIDNRLLDPHKASKRRFTIAHEIAHYITDVQTPYASFHNEFDPEMEYTEVELKRLFAFDETQMNNLAGILLTPAHKLEKVYKKVTGGNRLVQYGYRTLDADTRGKINTMARMMHVSPLTMRIRLERLHLFDHLPIEQYIESGCFDLNYSLFGKENSKYV